MLCGTAYKKFKVIEHSPCIVFAKVTCWLLAGVQILVWVFIFFSSQLCLEQLLDPLSCLSCEYHGLCPCDKWLGFYFHGPLCTFMLWCWGTDYFTFYLKWINTFTVTGTAGRYGGCCIRYHYPYWTLCPVCAPK